MAGRPNRRGWGWIRRLPSKRYHVSYVGPDGKRHNGPTTFGVKAAAEAWLVDERRLIDHGQWSPPGERKAERKTAGLTVGSYASEWIERRTLKHRTREHYLALLANHIGPTLTGTPVRSLTPAVVRSWYASLDPDHPTARLHAYSLLHAVMAQAVADELIEVNPCAITHRRTDSRQPVILTVVEIATVAEEIEPQRFKALVLISAWCGLRWGEVTELRRRDVSVDVSVLSVRRAVTHRRGCHISTPKSGRARTVTVPPHIRADIKHHLDAFTNTDPEALLFPASRGGCHLDSRSFRTSFDAVLKSIGREGVRIHDLRHFAGTQVARVSSLVETMTHLGHSTVGSSLRYQHMVSGREAQIAEDLSRLAEAHPNDEKSL